MNGRKIDRTKLFRAVDCKLTVPVRLQASLHPTG